jgi:isoamylase
LGCVIRAKRVTAIRHRVHDHFAEARFTSQSPVSGKLATARVLIHTILNAFWGPLEFELPLSGKGGGGPWRRWIDTALDPPHDIVEWKEAPSVSAQTYRAGPRSVAVLFAGVGKHTL